MSFTTSCARDVLRPLVLQLEPLTAELPSPESGEVLELYRAALLPVLAGQQQVKPHPGCRTRFQPHPNRRVVHGCGLVVADGSAIEWTEVTLTGGAHPPPIAANAPLGSVVNVSRSGRYTF